MKLIISQEWYAGFINWKTDKEPFAKVLASSKSEAERKLKKINSRIQTVFECIEIME